MDFKCNMCDKDCGIAMYGRWWCSECLQSETNLTVKNGRQNRLQVERDIECMKDFKGCDV